MYPVLLSFGPVTISSFGLFLALAVLVGIFVVWRLVRVYDIDPEKTFDLSLLSFLGGLIGARLLYVALNWELFGNFERIALINRYPGLSFWGGLMGGLLTLWLFTKRTRLNFWQVADFASVGMAAGLIVGDLGCFLGGCSYGIVSTLPIAMNVVGLIGKRFPISLIEAVLIYLLFLYLWKNVVRFHFLGKIAAVFLVGLGIIKFCTEYYRGDIRFVGDFQILSLGQIFSLILILYGVIIFYSQSKRHLKLDLVKFLEVFYSTKRQKQVITSIRRSWYNQRIGWKVKLQKKF